MSASDHDAPCAIKAGVAHSQCGRCKGDVAKCDRISPYEKLMRMRSKEELASRVVQLEDFIDAMNDQRILTCVYCGQPYPPGTPSHGTSVLTEHVKACEKHPMRKLIEALKFYADPNTYVEPMFGIIRDDFGFTLDGEEGVILPGRRAREVLDGI